jgi:hypothetical protein
MCDGRAENQGGGAPMPGIIGFLVSLLILVLVLSVIYMIGKLIISIIPGDPGLKAIASTILYIIILLIFLSALLGFTGWVPGWHLGYHRF